MLNRFFSDSLHYLLLQKIKFFNFQIIEFEKVLIKKTLFWPILGLETHSPLGLITELESI